MDQQQHFLRMFNYDHWANRECLNAASAAQPAKVLRLLGHTLAAQRLWLERLQGQNPAVTVWPSTSVQECCTLADEMLSSWEEYLDALPPGGFAGKVAYRNSKGEPWSSRVDDILTHVLLHSAYHRGQAALEMRVAGLQPAYTDFIHGVRQGFVE